MKYEVIHNFTDLLDNRYAYAIGDSFPRKGVDVSEERLKELSGPNNKQGVPLIRKVKTKSKDSVPKNNTSKKKKVEKDADGTVQGTE